MREHVAGERHLNGEPASSPWIPQPDAAAAGVARAAALGCPRPAAAAGLACLRRAPARELTAGPGSAAADDGVDGRDGSGEAVGIAVAAADAPSGVAASADAVAGLVSLAIWLRVAARILSRRMPHEPPMFPRPPTGNG